MKHLSLQWRITLMSVLLIGVTCVAMNLLLCSSGMYYIRLRTLFRVTLFLSMVKAK